MTKCWSGAEVDCPKCGGEVEYVKDMDHDFGTCEIFDCLVCGHRIHVEMPDG